MGFQKCSHKDAPGKLVATAMQLNTREEMLLRSTLWLRERAGGGKTVKTNWSGGGKGKGAKRERDPSGGGIAHKAMLLEAFMATRASGGVERRLRRTGREEAKGQGPRESETQAVGDCSQSNVVGGKTRSTATCIFRSLTHAKELGRRVRTSHWRGKGS